MRSTGDFTRDKFAWIEQVLDDHDVIPMHFKIAVAIARHLNRESGVAFPSMPRLAEMVGTSERTVRTAVEVLRNRRHLDVKTGHGPGHPNNYSLILENRKHASGFMPEMRKPASGISDANAEAGCTKTGSRLPPNTMTEHYEEHFERESTRKKPRRLSREVTQNLDFTTTWPPGFSLDENMRRFAIEKGLQNPDELFERFAAYSRSKGRRNVDWTAAWEGWCLNENRFEAGTKNQAGLSAAQGIADQLRGRKS